MTKPQTAQANPFAGTITLIALTCSPSYSVQLTAVSPLITYVTFRSQVDSIGWTIMG
jgi:hypothetical protein